MNYNYYESVVIIEPTLSEEKLQETLEKIREKIQKEGGEIVKEDFWGLKKLAYELNKRTEGYYMFFTIKAPPDLIKKLEDFYRVFEPVFKFMTVKLKKKPQIEALMEELQSSASSEKETTSQTAETVGASDV